MNGIGQQAKAYVSPFPTKFMTDQNKRIYKVQIQVLENTYMYVNYMICKAFIKESNDQTSPYKDY